MEPDQTAVHLQVRLRETMVLFWRLQSSWLLGQFFRILVVSERMGSRLMRSLLAAVLLILLGLWPYARAQEPAGLTLACHGMITNRAEGKSGPISMGVFVNFPARTVHGFGGPAEIKITRMDEGTIVFDGTDPEGANQLTSSEVHGTINRVTGDLEAISTLLLKQDTIGSLMSYSLKCRPAQRTFQ